MQPRGGLSRRGILQSIAGAAVATTLLPGRARADRGWGREWEDEDRDLPTRLRPVPQIKGTPGTEKYWRKREEGLHAAGELHPHEHRHDGIAAGVFGSTT